MTLSFKEHQTKQKGGKKFGDNGLELLSPALLLLSQISPVFFYIQRNMINYIFIE